MLRNLMSENHALAAVRAETMELLPFKSRKEKVLLEKQTIIGDWTASAPQDIDEKLRRIYDLFLALSEGITIRRSTEYEKYFKPSKETYPIQSWFKCREGFSIELIKKILSENSCPRKILDPFCGSGTTLVASTELGIASVGFDVNPLVTFAAKVKTRRYSFEDIEKLETLTSEILQITNSEKAPAPKLSIIEKVFNMEILETLLRIKHQIYSIPEGKYQDFLKLGWLAVLESVSNTRKEGNGIKYKFTKRTSKGYISEPQKEWEDKQFGKKKKEYVLERLRAKYKQMLVDLKKFHCAFQEPTIFNESALQLTKFLDKEISVAIFSPPYANCFDYFEIFKVELWMGDFAKSRDELLLLRNRALRSNTNTNLDFSRGNLGFFHELDELLNLIDEKKLWNKKLKKLIKGYFEDMTVVLREIYNVLEPDGKCIIVVGNSAYAGVIIPTDLLLSKIGKEIGFQNVEIRVARHLTTSSQQRRPLLGLKDYLRESVIVLEKSKGALLAEDIPLNQPISLGQKFIITSNNVAYLTHNIHKYPSKFIPQIPRWAIQKYLSQQQRGRILDPFCGSGTTLVEGILAGHDVFGMDVDPLARLITKVKITPLDERKLLSTYREVVQKVIDRKDGQFKPNLPTLNHWFSEQTIRDLSVIRDVIEEYKADVDLYDFLMVSLSSIIRKVSNADNESQKTYVSHTNIKKLIPAKDYFLKKLEEHVERIIQFSRLKPKTAEYYIFDNADARVVDVAWAAKFQTNKIDLAVTSPPYVKAVDYIYTQMAEYFWIGDRFDLATQKKQNAYKTRYVGTKQIFAKDYSELRLFGMESLDKKLRKIYDKNKKFAYITYKFFLDMKLNIESIGQILRENGHYIVVVGDCSVSNEHIPVHEYVAEIANNCGYEVENSFYYQIRNHYMRFPRNGRGGLITHDWVVDLRKT